MDRHVIKTHSQNHHHHHHHHNTQRPPHQPHQDQDQSRGLQVQRDESDDGRHSLGSCCPEDLSVRSRLLRESDPRTRGPQSLVRSDTTVMLHQSRAGALEPQSGLPDGVAGRGGRRRAVLGQGCCRARGCLGFLVGPVQFLDKAADVPVVVPQLLFLVVDDPVVQVVAWVRPVPGQDARCCADLRQGGRCPCCAGSEVVQTCRTVVFRSCSSRTRWTWPLL